MTATQANKPSIKRLIKGVGVDPAKLKLDKNNWWTVKPGPAIHPDQWKAIHEAIAQGLTTQGIRFQSYGHAIQIYL
jgi:hypothetical protein